jgi:hypothetical protein
VIAAMVLSPKSSHSIGVAPAFWKMSHGVEMEGESPKASSETDFTERALESFQP